MVQKVVIALFIQVFFLSFLQYIEASCHIEDSHDDRFHVWSYIAKL